MCFCNTCERSLQFQHCVTVRGKDGTSGQRERKTGLSLLHENTELCRMSGIRFPGICDLSIIVPGPGVTNTHTQLLKSWFKDVKKKGHRFCVYCRV